MPDTSITVTFDLNRLSSYTDSFLATLWHVAQANPAPFGDYQAGEIVAKLGFEIVRRWLAQAPAEIYHHQPQNNLQKALSAIATYQPPADLKPGTPGISDPHWHDGTWVPKTGEASQ